MKQVKAIKRINQADMNDLLALFSSFQGKEVQITIESLDPEEAEEQAFKEAGMSAFFKDDQQADSIYDQKYGHLAS
ncbi:MAG: hypothetical protein SFT81_02925 [Candidatus Caenarcaniphilales bacterium]|nr:hypothetical protein [Candidatus Caenarcaniphilales bacterium]